MFDQSVNDLRRVEAECRPGTWTRRRRRSLRRTRIEAPFPNLYTSSGPQLSAGPTAMGGMNCWIKDIFDERINRYMYKENF